MPRVHTMCFLNPVILTGALPLHNLRGFGPFLPDEHDKSHAVQVGSDPLGGLSHEYLRLFEHFELG
jgi:hypothetical protein